MFKQKSNSSPVRTATILIINSVLISLSSDIHLPALPLMQKDLNATEFQSQMVLMIFMLGAVFSRLIWGPLSDFYGRRKVLLFTLFLQLIAQTGLVMSNQIETFIFWRGFQSLGSGVITVIGTVIIADSFKGDHCAKYLGLHEMAFPIGFVIAPLIGAALLEHTHDWRIAFKFMWFVLVFCFCMCYFLIPETNKNLQSVARVSTSFKMYLKLVKNKIFVTYSLILGLTIGMYMTFAISSPFIYMVGMSLTINQYAFMMFLPMLINIVSALLYKHFVLLQGINRCIVLGVTALLLMLPLYLAIGFNFIDASPNVVLIAMCLQMAFVPLITPGFAAKSIGLYPEIKGLASSAAASVRSLCASILMICGSKFIGSEVHGVFFVMSATIILILILFVYSLKLSSD